MGVHPRAGRPATRDDLVDVPKLIAAYYSERPDPQEPSQRVAFGTSGHRGSSIRCTFNHCHILAITAAIVEFRREKGITGPLYLGVDTHALSEPARRTALEVLAAHGVDTMIDSRDGFTPTPVISHAILSYNHGRKSGLADGIVITPSHNPPEDGGFKYNPPHGGPADAEITKRIEERANALIRAGSEAIDRMPYTKALKAPQTHLFDFMTPYVDALGDVIDFEAIRSAGLKLGADPMGGAGIAYWEPIRARYGLDIEVVNTAVDPTFSFMTLDRDGKIRMDCSSPHAMASLIAHGDRFDIAFGNDTDYDRHGIVTRSAGLLNPNHYLAVAIDYLFRTRNEWRSDARVGKTLVSSAMIDRVAADLGRPLAEVPVGFKWFVGGLLDGSFGFGGEESAGASFLRRDGRVWSTDKDGFILDLLAAEISATTGKDPGESYRDLVRKHGEPAYQRIDAPATLEQKQILKNLAPSDVVAEELAGEKIEAKLTRAPGNDEPIGGLKVVTKNGWFAARPSGTEDVYKIYGESFLGPDHLKVIQQEAEEIVHAAFVKGGTGGAPR